jgi:hypothetical protein
MKRAISALGFLLLAGSNVSLFVYARTMQSYHDEVSTNLFYTTRDIVDLKQSVSANEAAWKERSDTDYKNVAEAFDGQEEKIAKLEKRLVDLASENERLIGAVEVCIHMPDEERLKKKIIGDMERMKDDRKFDAQMAYLEKIGASAEAKRLRSLRRARQSESLQYSPTEIYSEAPTR